MFFGGTRKSLCQDPKTSEHVFMDFQIQVSKTQNPDIVYTRRWPWKLQITYEFQFSFNKGQSRKSRLNPSVKKLSSGIELARRTNNFLSNHRESTNRAILASFCERFCFNPRSMRASVILVRFPNPHYVVGWGTEPLHRG